MKQDLLARLRAHVIDQRLFPEPGVALLAVSGGPDSVAMLDLFAALGAELGLQLAVAHVDHGIALEGGDVADQVAAVARHFGLPCYHVRLALGHGASETQAREARYRELRRLQDETGARYLLTAHHADDQAETVLYRFLRGSGTAGLAGIPVRGPNGIIRPLLPFTRVELQQWLLARGNARGMEFPVHHDPANTRGRHDRSWIRQHLLPRLRRRFGSVVDERLLDVARHAEGERGAWASLLRALPELEFRADEGVAEVARSPLQGYDKLLSEALLRALAREAGCIVGPRRAERLLRFAATAPSGRRLELGGGWEAEVAFDRLRIVRVDLAANRVANAAVWGIGEAGRAHWTGWEVSWREGTAGEPSRTAFATWVTAGPGAIRAPRAGDRMVPLGGVGNRKVRRLLMEARVPWRDRGAYPLLVRRDAVLWIPGVCRAGVAVPAPGSRALRVEAHAVGNG
jgi:tRNA(Ile)-lysidine synthase